MTDQLCYNQVVNWKWVHTFSLWCVKATSFELKPFSPSATDFLIGIRGSGSGPSLRDKEVLDITLNSSSSKCDIYLHRGC